MHELVGLNVVLERLYPDGTHQILRGTVGLVAGHMIKVLVTHTGTAPESKSPDALVRLALLDSSPRPANAPQPDAAPTEAPAAGMTPTRYLIPLWLNTRASTFQSALPLPQ